MNKIRIILEYGYFFIALIFLIQAINTYQTDIHTAIVSLFFVVFSVAMFFLKRYMRRKRQ
ncbi:MAG: hypothetical protein HRT66_01275 [Flavobacteriaceae bacterium]|nr:hypothetical protein [Flavobacteriaceae bacterium]